MSRNLIALQKRFLGVEKTAFDLLCERLEARGEITAGDIDSLAREHQLPPQLLRTVAEFYDELKPVGKSLHKLRVCNGEACQAAGSAALRERLRQRFGHLPAEQLVLDEVTCLGYCSIGPNVWLDETPLSLADGNTKAGTESGPDLERKLDLIAQRLAGLPATGLVEPANACHAPATGKPMVLMGALAQAGASLAQAREMGAYRSLEQALFKMTPEQVLREIETSHLRGRGGAGFPLARKLQTVRDSGNDQPNDQPSGQSGPKKYLVVNFDEGDAGAYIDKELVERAPHLLLEGALLAAFACGAGEIILYARREYPRARQVLAQALAQAGAERLTGPAVAGSAFACAARMVTGQGAYICGEETSLLRSIEGLPATVSIRPPFPAQEGLWRRPTAVCNVETLCNLPWIIREGGEQYARLGYADSRGTKLISLNTRVRKPGLYEVELGTSLREIIFGLAGGMAAGEVFKAVQIGGPLGGILPEAALDTPLDFEALQQAGGILGHGGMVVYSQRDDLLRIARGLMAFCARESCGKCFPCRIGSVRGTELLDQIIDKGASPNRLALLNDICATMKTGSLCAMGSMTPAGVESVLTYFPEELGPRSAS